MSQNSNQELIDALEILTKGKEGEETQEINDLIEDLKKSSVSKDEVEKSEDEGKDKKDNENSEEDYNEEEYEKMKSEYEDMEKACGMKKAAMDEYLKKKPQKTEKSEEESEIQKSEDSAEKDNSNLLKSIEELIESKLGNKDNTEIDDIKKSIEGLSESLTSIKGEIEAFGSQPQGKKAHQYKAFIEKGEDIEDKKQLHIQHDKGKIQDMIEKSIDSTQNTELKSILENDLISYNTGGKTPSKATLVEITKSNDVTIVY